MGQQRAGVHRHRVLRSGTSGIGEYSHPFIVFTCLPSRRFIRAASDNSTANHPVVFTHPSGSSFATADVPIGELNADVLDVAFTRTLFEDNYPGGGAGLRRDHRFAPDAAPLGEHWSHKYLLDLDGMGYSAKFFALMESESAVLKATVFEEFWSDWVQPWCAPSFPLTPVLCALLMSWWE